MAIIYTEKGYGLHEAIVAAGHWLEERDGVWVSSDDAAVQAIIDSYDPIPSRRAALSSAVAQERIDRQAAGARYAFPDGQTGTIQTRDVQDLININGLATRAMMAPGATFQFRDQENRTHPLTAAQVGDLATAAAGFVESLYAAKWQHDAAIEAWVGGAPYDVNLYWPGSK